MVSGSINSNYKQKYGFSVEEKPVYKAKPGINKKVVSQISKIKNEPEWVLKYRLDAFNVFKKKDMPKWCP